MPNPIIPLIPIAGSLGGIAVGTVISEGIAPNPKAIVLFYVEIAKACYVSTGSTRIACGVATIVCAAALVPGPQQAPFVVSCAAAARATHKVN